MKTRCVVGVLATLAALARAGDNAQPLSFDALNAATGSDAPNGGLRPADLTAASTTFGSAAPSPTPSIVPTGFASDPIDADVAARVNADPVDVATSPPPLPPTNTTAPWMPSSVMPFRDGDSANQPATSTPLLVVTDPSAMAFSALPTSAETDLQGYLFGDRPSDNITFAANTTRSKMSNNGSSSGDAWWRDRVCSSSPDACAVAPSNFHRRRLADASSDGKDLSAVERDLGLAMGFRTASSLATIGIAFASGPVSLALGLIAFAFNALFAESAQSAFTNLLKTVNKEYANLNDDIKDTSERIAAAPEIRSMRTYVRAAYSYDNTLRTIAARADPKASGDFAVKTRGFCEQRDNNLRAKFYDALMDTDRYMAAMETYYRTRSRGYVAEATFYLQGLYAAYLSYTKCAVAANPDVAKLQAKDKEIRGDISKAAGKMAAVAWKMRTDFVANIKGEVEKAVGDGNGVADVNRLTDMYDWLEFKAYKSDVTKCANAGTGVIDSRCGLIMVSKKTCHIIAWHTRFKESEKDEDQASKIEKGTNLDAKYMEVPKNQRCGFGYEAPLQMRPPRTRPPQRRLEGQDEATRILEEERVFAGINVYVQSTLASPAEITMPDIKESEVDQKTIDASKDPLEEKLNNAKDEKERMKILAEEYTNTSRMSQSIKSRDMAMWFALETNLKEVKDMYDERDTMVDSIVGTVKDVHEIEMARANGIYNDLVTTGTQEVQALVNLETQTTGQHNDEIAQMDVIDNQLTTLSNTLTTGFSGTASDIDAVERDTTQALQQLSGTVQTTGAQTRAAVKNVIAQATQKTLEHLDGLESLIETKSAEKLTAARGLQDLVTNAGNQIRNGVATEFNARAEQLQQRVAGLTDHIYSAAAATANALVTESDAMRTDLGRRIAYMTNQLDIIDGRIKVTEKLLDKINSQVDDILGLIGSLNTKLSGIFRSLRDLPNRIRQVVMVKTVEDKFRQAERLSFAYANYIKHNMNQLQAFEFVQQCDAIGEALLFDNLIDRLKRGEAVLQKELATFNNSRVDYEQFGNRIIAAAYHLRYMLMPCGNMRTLMTTGRAAFSEATSRSQADKLNTAVWTFQQSMEETVPQLFLKKIYTASFLQSLVDDVRRSVATSAASESTAYALAAIEPLRYQLQQHVSAFAAISVIQPDQRSRLTVWTKSTKVSMGISRFGMLRLSTMSGASASTPDDLLVLWSNTRQQIPTSLQDKFRIPLTKASLASDGAVSAALANTPYEPYWTAGLVQSIVFVERVNNTACPWAISTSHYPFCYETGTYDDGGCVCVQLEGLDSATPRAPDDAPSPLVLQTTLTGKSPATNPRADFVITSLTKAPTTALTTTTMIGVPENRRAFAVCMSSPLPARVCIANKFCHQPPPSTTRCLTNPETTYKVVYPPPGSASVFIDSGDSITADMFRSMELGAAIPDITFFDTQLGDGNFIVCTDCTIQVLRSIYMFRVAAFKIGRPKSEAKAVCRQHPRYENVEFCVRLAGTPDLWTPQSLLQGELVQTLQQFGQSLPANLTDPQELAVAVNDRVQALLNDEVGNFKVYVARTGSFNATTNSNAYWTSLPNHEAGLERGWTVVPALYSTISENKALVFDALIMWSTLRVEERNFAKLVVEKKPVGQSLKAYLDSSFGEYGREKILRGFFSEPFSGPDCPVAGDTDHFAYCTPSPVDKMCLCVQLEDLPEEYTELYDGSAPSGRVVSFPLDDAQSAFVVGRTKGAFSLGSRQPVGTWDGIPMRNISARSVCVSDYNHPELGATCMATTNDQSLSAASSVRVGTDVSSVLIQTATWTALCTGCSDSFVSQISAFGSAQASVFASGGAIAGGSCRSSTVDGGGEVQVCLNQNA